MEQKNTDGFPIFSAVLLVTGLSENENVILQTSRVISVSLISITY